jgi:SNF2 family DNA or RNA helicase
VLANQEDGRGFDDFFSLEKKNSNVESKQKKTLIELTVNGEFNFYISQFFYEMLFKHQTEALQWLLSQHVMRKGSILADEMGLGKTISAISLMSTLYSTHW